MKFSALFFILALPACAPEQKVAWDPAGSAGRWTGAGKFAAVKLDSAHGRLPFELRIDETGALTGAVGDAQLVGARAERGGGRQYVYATLQGAVHAAPEFKNKDHLILIVTAVDAQRIEAGFHLKSNFTWDFGMIVGGVELRKDDPPAARGSAPQAPIPRP